MKKILLVLLCTAIACINIKAQQIPFLQWQKSFGGNSYDQASSVEQTKDTGYIIAGSELSKNITGHHGGFRYDAWILKLDAAAHLQWSKTIGGIEDDHANDIHKTTDGGYIVAGNSFSNDGDVSGNHGNSDYWVVKLDTAGNIQWQKTYGGSGYDVAGSIQQTKDGGYIVAGFTYSNDGDVTGNHGDDDYWIVKLDAAGNMQWQRAYGGFSYDEANNIQQTKDGGYIVAGYTWSRNDGDVTGNHRIPGGGDARDYWIVKVDMLGNIQWQKCYGGYADDVANSIKQTSDGGYIIAGAAGSNDGDVTGNHGDDDYWIVKIDSLGNIQWQKCYGGYDGDVANSIRQTSDGGYIIAGTSGSKDGDVTGNHGSSDYWIVKIDVIGNIEWQKSLGGSNEEGIRSIQQTIDSGYIIAGASSSNDGNVTGNHNANDYWIVKLSPVALNDSITIFPYHIAKHCAGTSDVSCDIKNKSKAYTVRLYRFGEIYDSALNVTGHTGFHNLPQGAYYVTATDDNGAIYYSEEVAVEPTPANATTTNITATTAQLNWSGFNCADDYRVQFRMQGDTIWQTRQTGHNVMYYLLSNLKPSTTYVWKVGSRNRENGIQAKGKFCDSVVFTTASAITTTNQNNITINHNAKTLLFNVSPNPAKNYFVINFKDDTQQKIDAVLYDVNGKAVWTSGLINASALNNKQVNATQFAKGVFYLKLMNQQGELIGSTKIVIAK